ncbi:hypothetical protein [Patulibacter defluvii]|uniref:hypothetical protein n=1 Tax=Patulibacter defluvii TaxID=3095358 RepID=UPI002A756DC2|nr:hypothetical protein [Patulibacter sp. DM4]
MPIPGTHRSSIGADLERIRLEHRARRIAYVLAALRDREGTSARRPLPGLERLRDDYAGEWHRVRARLAELERSPAARRARPPR